MDKKRLQFIYMIIIITTICTLFFLILELKITETFYSITAVIIGMVAAFFSSTFIRIIRRNRYKIFVSYSYKDTDIVGELVNQLQSDNHKYLTADKDIRTGETYLERLDEIIDSSDMIIIIISDDYAEDEGTYLEFQKLLDSGKPIFPIVIGEAPIPSDLAEIKVLRVDLPINKNLGRIKDDIQYLLSKKR